MPRRNVVSKPPRAHRSARQSLNLCLPEGQGDKDQDRIIPRLGERRGLMAGET
jgi:hypothetical protein